MMSQRMHLTVQLRVREGGSDGRYEVGERLTFQHDLGSTNCPMYTHVYVYVHVCTCTCTMYMYVHVHVCTCMYMYYVPMYMYIVYMSTKEGNGGKGRQIEALEADRYFKEKY